MAFNVFNQTLTLQRTGPGGYTGGLWQEGTSGQVSIRSSVQPSSPKELQLLPEGRREAGAFTLYSKTEIRLEDVVMLFGDPYEILKVEIWQNRILPHYKAIAVKMQKEGET